MERTIYKSLTETHSNRLLGRNGLISPGAAYFFVKDVIQKGKLTELSSFLAWEVLHKTGAWSKDDYLYFAPTAPLLTEVTPFFEQKNFSLSCGTTTEIARLPVRWSLVFFDSRANLYGNTKTALNILFRLSSAREGAVPLFEFEGEIKGIYINTEGIIFVCCAGCLYRSADGGHSFQKVLQFSTNHSYFRHNNAFTEKPNGDLFVGEYVCIWRNSRWHCAAYVYFSQNKGESWTRTSFLQHEKINKHVHILKYSRLFNGLILTDGDNKKKLWINQSEKGFEKKSASATEGWKELTHYHFQQGGHTAMVELNDTLFFGTDYLGGTNFLISTKDLKSFRRQIVPDPYRRAYFTNMIVRKAADGSKELWATLYAGYNSKTKSLLMFSADAGKSWTKVIEYDGSKYIVEMISSSLQVSEHILLMVQKRRGPTVTLRISNKNPSPSSPLSEAVESISQPARS